MTVSAMSKAIQGMLSITNEGLTRLKEKRRSFKRKYAAYYMPHMICRI